MTRSLLTVVAALVSAAWISSAAAAPQITSVTPEIGPTTGGSIITISGANFGASGNFVTLGGRLCVVTVQNANEIQCALPEGTGASRPIRVVDDLGVASPPYPFAYSPPAITSVTAASVPTSGNVPITIQGSNFGAAGSDRRVTVNGSAGSCNAALEVPHTQIVCTLPPGEGHDVPVDVTVDGQRSAPSPLSYDPPAITAITPTRGAPSGSGRIITIRGDNFGAAASVTVGGSQCPLEVQTHDRIECALPPDGGAPPAVRVFAGGQASGAFAYSYAQVPSKCDAAKFKVVAGYAKCLATAEATAAKKGVEPSAEAFAKCDAKMAAACTKAETTVSGCTQVGTCDDLALRTKHKGWDGTIHGSIR